MLGDVLLIEDKHKMAAQDIVPRIANLSGDKIVIAVGGESGFGKVRISSRNRPGVKGQRHSGQNHAH